MRFTARTLGCWVAALLALSVVSTGWSAEEAAKAKKKILYYTKSRGFEHSVVKRAGDQLSHSEKILTALAEKAGYEIVCSRDGTLFEPGKIGQFDGFVFYATGDLTKGAPNDPDPPMSPAGKKALLEAIAAGKGLVGIHAASDAFRLGGYDPFIRVLGGEFISHGKQQKTTVKVVDPNFPGMQEVKDFEMLEEWYAHKNLGSDMHVILVQETKGMEGDMYARPAYPAAWARREGKGRVYYISLGHREDVWENPVFQKMLMGGIAWAVRDARAKVPANLQETAPQPPKFMAPVKE